MRAFIAVVCLVAAVSARSLQCCLNDTKSLLFQKRDGPDHWTATWMASEEDVKNAKEGEVKEIKGKLLADVKEFDGALERLLSGKGNKEDEKKAADALEGSVMLTLIDAEEDAIEPMDLDVPDECSRDTVAGLGGCEDQFVRIGQCLRGAAKAVRDALTSDKSDVEQVSFVKGVIVLIASGAEDIGKLAKSCGYAKREFEDWAKAGLVSEDDLKDVDPAEVEEVGKNLRKDMDVIGQDLDQLLKEGVESEAAERVEEHLESAVALAMLHEEQGAGSIKPAKIDIPKGCRKEDFGSDCKENFERVVRCLKGAVDGMKAAFDSEAPVARKIAKVKGIVGLVAKATGPIKALAKDCGHEKKREFEDWAKAGLASGDDLKNADPAEIEKVGKNLRKDMDEIEKDLDGLLKEGIDGPAAEKVEQHLEGAVALAELHEKQGAKSIPPAKIEIPKGCRKEDFGMDCEENFKRVVGCLKKAVQGMKETMDSDAPEVQKVAKVKGIVGLVAKATGPIKKLHDACTQKRSLARFFN
ncbi:uncharacterized protein LOC134239369 [Saccostrea cucullata]|uniref:uncharacterized protein LOC134239369 n=1 Tax=Saccostrea cuccullata TaxID=36930 RepID=UPI002ED1AB1F